MYVTPCDIASTSFNTYCYLATECARTVIRIMFWRSHRLAPGKSKTRGRAWRRGHETLPHVARSLPPAAAAPPPPRGRAGGQRLPPPLLASLLLLFLLFLLLLLQPRNNCVIARVSIPDRDQTCVRCLLKVPDTQDRAAATLASLGCQAAVGTTPSF